MRSRAVLDGPSPTEGFFDYLIHQLYHSIHSYLYLSCLHLAPLPIHAEHSS